MMKKKNNKMPEMSSHRNQKFNLRFREETRNKTNEETNHMRI